MEEMILGVEKNEPNMCSIRATKRKTTRKGTLRKWIGERCFSVKPKKESSSCLMLDKDTVWKPQGQTVEKPKVEKYGKEGASERVQGMAGHQLTIRFLFARCLVRYWVPGLLRVKCTHGIQQARVDVGWIYGMKSARPESNKGKTMQLAWKIVYSMLVGAHNLLTGAQRWNTASKRIELRSRFMMSVYWLSRYKAWEMAVQ